MVTASAPAKLILCGEHAVVYGRPAIAIPLSDVRAYGTGAPAPVGQGLHFLAPDLGEGWTANDQPDHPLSELALATLAHLGIAAPDLTMTLRADIPVASGMGSGAAIGTALIRALAAHAGHELPPAEVAALVYASERRYHGTPSGLDNTVVAYEQAIWFVRTTTLSPTGGPQSGTEAVPLSPTIEPLVVGVPLTLVVGDTGVRSATKLPVGAVRQGWQADPSHFEDLFDAIGDLVIRARSALAVGDLVTLGHLLDANQTLLEQVGVSSPELERLVKAARAAGALGAKLSGAGWGGVMLALTTPTARSAVEAGLRAAGAVRVLGTTVTATT